MTKSETAVAIFNEGLNCCQSLLGAFCEDLKLPKELALKLATGFGGGVASKGDICGAVSGAIMVIGLKYGRTVARDLDAKEKTYQLIDKLINRFTEKHGSITCRNLLGYDLSIATDRQHIQNKDLFNTLCPLFVRDAALIVEELLESNN